MSVGKKLPDAWSSARSLGPFPETKLMSSGARLGLDYSKLTRGLKCLPKSMVAACLSIDGPWLVITYSLLTL